MDQLLIITVACTAVILFGIGLYLLSKWARRKSLELAAQEREDRHDARNFLNVLKLQLLGSLPEPEATVVKIIALIATIICIGFLGVAISIVISLAK